MGVVSYQSQTPYSFPRRCLPRGVYEYVFMDQITGEGRIQVDMYAFII